MDEGGRIQIPDPRFYASAGSGSLCTRNYIPIDNSKQHKIYLVFHEGDQR